jgi:hypothetical protein
MSLAGIAASSFFSGAVAQSNQAKLKQTGQALQQLGQDLRAGNLTQAQTDFAALQKEFPAVQPDVATSLRSSGTVQQAIQQLGKDLGSGNLPAAQSDFKNLQQDIQQGTGTAAHGHHHRRLQDSNVQDSGASPTDLAQVFSQLGQTLHSGDISAAQQSYATLLQDFQQSGPSTGSSAVSVFA